MKYILKILGILLAAVVLINLAFGSPIHAQAAESNTLKISLGSNNDAYFEGSDKRTVEKTAGSTVTVASLVDDVKIKAEADGTMKYIVKGVRLAGDDHIYGVGESIDVTRNETYVVAYGIGEIKKYIVKYVDDTGKLLDESKLGSGVSNPEEFYGIYKEETKVPARHVQYYSPDADVKVAHIGVDSLNDSGITEISFEYKNNPVSEKEVIVEKTNIVVKYEDPTINYEYEYVNEPSTVTTTTNNNPSVVTERRVTGTNTGTTGNTGTTSNRNVAAADTNNAVAIGDEEVPLDGGDNKNDNEDSTDSTTISDESVPLSGDDSDKGEEKTIEDENVPTSAEVQASHLAFNILITLIIIVIAFIVVMFIINQKKSSSLAEINDRDKLNKK